MLRAVICKGDPTSHGGKVLEGNELVTTNGRAVAQKGHMTVCPQCKGQFPITEGLDFHTYAGIGTAVDGMKTACGAKLIATQQQMLIDDAGGGENAAASPLGVASPDEQRGKYSGAFRAVDEHSGESVAGLPYRIELPDGRTVRGVTDKDGLTSHVSSDTPDTVKLYWEAEASDE
nr:PAAR domain-containing protein [uncultured Duganella sp.]